MDFDLRRTYSTHTTEALLRILSEQHSYQPAAVTAAEAELAARGLTAAALELRLQSLEEAHPPATGHWKIRAQKAVKRIICALAQWAPPATPATVLDEPVPVPPSLSHIRATLLRKTVSGAWLAYVLYRLALTVPLVINAIRFDFSLGFLWFVLGVYC